MKVFMLGWELPPYISGGVGAACHGLAQALLDTGTNVLFMLPRPVQVQARPQVKVVQQTLPALPAPPPRPQPHHRGSEARGFVEHGDQPTSARGAEERMPQAGAFPFVPTRKQIERITFRTIDALLWPYLTPQQYQQMIIERQEMVESGVTPPPDPLPALAAAPASAPAVPVPVAAPARQTPPVPSSQPVAAAAPAPAAPQDFAEKYAPTLLEETHRYAQIALAVARKEQFELVHAHDWMTFEAARLVAKAAGKPLLVQIHSTEYDRAPYAPDPMVVETERAGMAAADCVIAVSDRVRQMLIERYGVRPERIEVVYNAIEQEEQAAPPRAVTFQPRGKLVLFLGRITAQKGPEHFLAAARKVLAVYPDAKFVLAGEGDRRAAMEQLAEELGIAPQVMFTGFLSRPEIDTLFQKADVYVMPSVSEPFGLVSLEALRSDVPVIISKQSGVAELLHHVLKVDFWDTDDLANKILAVLRYPPLAATLREEGAHEVRQLTWHDAARETVGIYRRLVRGDGMRNNAERGTRNAER